MDLKLGIVLLLTFLITASAYRTNENENRLTDYSDDKLYDYIIEKENRDDKSEDDNDDEDRSLAELLENDEENDFLDLNDDDEADFGKITVKKDPLFRRWRFRGRRFVPRVRRIVPRIRIRRIRLRRIRLPRIRVPRIRVRLRRLRFPGVRLRIRRPTPKPGKPEIDCSHTQKLYDTMGCDPVWKMHVEAEFVTQVYHSACFKHNICTSCMQSQPWTKDKCDRRLKTDMEASCGKITDDNDNPDHELINYCKSRVFGLHILATTKKYPSTAAAHCGKCIIPSGNPDVVVDLT